MRIVTSRLLYLFIAIVAIGSCKSDDDANPEDPRAENRRGLGTSAEELLSDDIYTSLTVEFVYSEGFRPQQQTIDTFRPFLDRLLNKPGGITFVETVIEQPDGKPYTTQEIREIENENRTQYTDGDNIAVFVYFANGGASGDTNTSVTLGTAYQNTSIVIYQETLQNINGLPNGPDLFLLEATTLRHEFGHILGLVNILDDDIHTIHEDPDNNRHCVVEDCLMYFESTVPGTIAFPMKGDIPVLDPLCLADLEAKGGK
ncbi:MAG: membrane metalloprotease [Flavobacteriaceae bacterium]|nr:membrane metalloprotease [Flavobacteriaceae bacterium]